MQISPPMPGPPKSGMKPAPPMMSGPPFVQHCLAPDWSSIFIAICCALFLLCVLLRLSGSSAAFWAQALPAPNEPTGLIVGHPRLTRSDEWLVWTPAALAQIHHIPPMPIENPALGAGASPLLMSLPVRHYSMLFRPQLWGFFVFDAERGFAWFWNTKILGLLLSYFLLFRLITGGRVALAILGSVAVSYSSCVQWFFSSPTMLPEMMASWALMLVAGKNLFDPSSSWRKIGAAALLCSCAINFVLSCYPPFQIPLVYLGLTLFGVLVWERRGKPFHGGFAWLAGTIVLTAAVLWPTFVAARPALEIIAHTSYPGARRGTGGTMPVMQLFSGLLNFFDGSRPHPAMFPNTSEASNFFPIWLPVIAGLLWRWRNWHARGESRAMTSRSMPLCGALAVFILFFSVYAVAGLPEWFCRITALNFVTEQRALLAIGVAGLMLTFASLRDDGIALVSGRGRIWIPTLIAFAALVYFVTAQRQNPVYLTRGYCALYIALSTLLGSFYFCAKPIVFACTFSGALLLNNFLVNPISRGLPILLHSQAARHIAAIYKSDPTAAWAAYERGMAAQFAIASGAHVLNGVKAVPDLYLLGQLDRAGSARDIYNRYGVMALDLPRPGELAARFEAVGGDSYRAFVSPFDPALRQAGLKYVVFPRMLSPEEIGGMKLIDALPENFLWIYKLD
jgi:hypothetical protein